MWVTVFDVLQWPAAILCGYVLGKAARARGASVWLAYGAALVLGAAIGLAHAWLAEAPAHAWKGFLIWAAWSAFGTVQGWFMERRPGSLTTLDLSGKNQ
jgi:hypothetical protein